jgi:hypothetical protein
VHATDFLSSALKDILVSLFFVLKLLQAWKLCGVNQEVLKLYGSSLEVLWSKFCDKSFMLFKICGVEVMKLLKKVDYTRENSKLHMEIMDVNKISHNFIKN